MDTIVISSKKCRFAIESWELLKYEIDKEMQIITVSLVHYNAVYACLGTTDI